MSSSLCCRPVWPRSFVPWTWTLCHVTAAVLSLVQRTVHAGHSACLRRRRERSALHVETAPFRHPQVRYRREHLSTRQPPFFPLLEDLMRDGSDGAALLAVVHYYCPEHMRLDGECGACPRGARWSEGREGTGSFTAPGARARGGNVEGDALPRAASSPAAQRTLRALGETRSVSLRGARALPALPRSA